MWSGPQLGCGVSEIMVFTCYIVASLTLQTILMQSEINTGPKQMWMTTNC